MILILGASGMLGHKVAEYLADFDVLALTRDHYEAFDSLDQFELTQDDFVVNCIGAIPQKSPSPENYIRLNSLFPKFLAENTTATIIQIATDCVYDGTEGNYTELDAKTASDIYGMTKSLGEIKRKRFLNLRCSIIGPELTSKKSLYEWVRNQPENETIYGYANHFWNGVTTDAFAQVVRGIIQYDMTLQGTTHLVPANQVSKYDLLRIIAEKENRTDLLIEPKLVNPVNRTLATAFPRLNSSLWNLAGFDTVPTIRELVSAIKG